MIVVNKYPKKKKLSFILNDKILIKHEHGIDN
jgi:hypothetical protein